MRKFVLSLSLSTMLLAPAGAVFAQTPAIEAEGEKSAIQCSDLNWSAAVIKRYPDIAHMCQGVVNYNGEHFVKVSGVVKRSNEKTARVTFPTINKSMEIEWPAELKVYVSNGDVVSPGKLVRGDDVTFFVNQKRLTAPKEY